MEREAPGAVTRQIERIYLIAFGRAPTSEEAKLGEEVVVHYAGWLSDGTLFDSSFARGMPTTFRLGEVIPGWNLGLQKMKPGGEAILVGWGDATCTGAVHSTASDLDEVIAEVAAARQTERGTRYDDRRSETAMEDRKRLGYF